MRIPHHLRLFLIALLVMFVAALSCSAQQPPEAAAPTSAPTSSSVVLVIDNSAAGKNSLPTLKRAAQSMAKQFGSEHEVALMTATNKPVLVQDFTADSALVSAAIDKIRPAGKLSFSDSLSSAVQHVRNNAVNERTAVIAFLADLDHTDQPPPAWEQAMRATPAVPIYVVAVRAGKWQTLEFAQRVAVMSGGAVYAPTKTSDLLQITKSIASRLGATAEASAQVRSNAPLRPLTPYSTLVVREIPVAQGNNTDEIGGGENILLQRILVQRLQNAKLFQDVRVSNAIDDPGIPAAKRDGPQTAGNELELLAMIVGFNRGNRALRQTVPMFGGASKMRVQVILRDRSTKQSVTSFVEQGSHASGLLGGSDEKVQAQAMLEVSNHIVETIRRMKRKP